MDHRFHKEIQGLTSQDAEHLWQFLSPRHLPDPLADIELSRASTG